MLLLPLALGAASCGTPTRAAGPAREAPRVAPREQEAPLPPPPEALAAMLRTIPLVARESSRGINPGQHALAVAVQSFGATAVPYVIELLRDDDPRVRHLAQYIVRDLKGLEAKHLDALVATMADNGGWVPPALARIGTPQAIEALVDHLRRHPQSETQVTFALAGLGGRAAVPLAHLFDGKAPVRSELADAICGIFRSMAKNATPAIDILMARARTAGGPAENRADAIMAIGCIGPVAGGANVALAALATQPELSRSVEAALVAIEAPQAVGILSERLRRSPDIGDLVTLAWMGERAGAAAPAVAALLRAPDREVRGAAARALGFLRSNVNASALVALLADQEDWRLPQAASESLGRLGVVAALPELERLASTHWYPPVRQSARRAIEVLRGRERYPTGTSRAMFGMEFFGYLIEAPAHSKRPRIVPGPNELGPNERKALRYVVPQLEAEGDDATTRTPEEQVPDVGLKLADGFLVGADRGEFGGELMHMDASKGSPTQLLGENIVGIHETTIGIVIATGLSHMAFNRGALYVARRAGPGKYEVTYWKTLPGAPRASGLTADGALFVSCEGGDILVKGSRIEMAGAAP